ncbi:hypothetical protein GCM10022259_17510 [Aquimarina mytili]
MSNHIIGSNITPVIIPDKRFTSAPGQFCNLKRIPTGTMESKNPEIMDKAILDFLIVLSQKK